MPDPRNKAGAAAIAAIKKCGLCGRPDSPPEWDRALNGATAGDPILVKHPSDERDDFFLVPLNPADPSARLGVWAMLDTKTLELREASLLKDWKAPAFPDPDKDVQLLSESETTLSDGSVKKFKPSEIIPNPKNLVWAPSSAAVLPYWPVKEFTVPHPKTGAPEKIYLNQEGEFHPNLGPDTLPEKTSPPSNSSKPTPKKTGLGPVAKGVLGAVVVGGGVIAYKVLTIPPPSPEVIILETFNHGRAGVADTGQKWNNVYFKERDGKALLKVGPVKPRQQRSFTNISGVTFLPESNYKLDIVVSIPSKKSPGICFGFRKKSTQNRKPPYAILRSEMTEGIPKTAFTYVRDDSAIPGGFYSKDQNEIITIMLRTGKELSNSEISLLLDGIQFMEPTRSDASEFNGIFIEALGITNGNESSIDSITLTRIPPQKPNIWKNF